MIRKLFRKVSQFLFSELRGSQFQQCLEIKRIVDDAPNMEKYICIKVTNKSCPLTKVHPEEIARDIKQLKKFSLEDVRTIVHLATKNECIKAHTNYLKIEETSYSNELKKILITYRNTRNNALYKKKAQDIYLNDTIMRGFSIEDFRKICFIVGYEDAEEDKGIIKDIKRTLKICGAKK